MIATFTPDVLTPLTFEQAAESMRAALSSTMTARPLDNVLALALAKNAFETARWKSMHCWNMGNVKAGESFVGMFTSFACGENLGDGVHWFEPDGTDKNLTKGTTVGKGTFPVPPGHPQTRFRAYANQFDGAYEYVDFVASSHYAAAWRALLTGDAIAFVHQLKAAHYFTGPEDAYAKGVLSLQHEFMAKLKGLSPEPAAVDWGKANASIRSLNLTSQLREDVAGHAGRDVADQENADSQPEPAA